MCPKDLVRTVEQVSVLGAERSNGLGQVVARQRVVSIAAFVAVVHRSPELAGGVEPPTCALQVRCATVAPRQRAPSTQDRLDLVSQLRDFSVWIGRSGKRIAVTVIGFTLIAAGLVMLVVPGPGLLAIAAGLAVLATEYTWARQALDETKRRTRGAARRLRRRTDEP